MSVFLLLTVVCNYPYQPQREPALFTPDTGTTQSGFSGSGNVYAINGIQQTCNPSIAPSGPFNGCMLFLGYDRFTLSVPDSLETFNDAAIKTHDRLIVADTTNTVRWFIINTTFGGTKDLQCPEWSTDENYSICLYGSIGKPYKAYAVRISDRSVFPMTSMVLEEFSTPHLWVDSLRNDSSYVDTVLFTDDSIASPDDISNYFGTSSVKFIYTLPSSNGALYFVDYSQNATPQPLQKPAGRESWQCASPLISPDGGWVTYHCYSNPTFGAYYASYIQRLSPEADPILIAEEASDPHWWVDPISGNDYIIYTATYGEYFTPFDFTDASITSEKLAGCTLKQLLEGTRQQVPRHIGSLSPSTSRSPDTLIHLPFKGGLSRDGYFLGTAYERAFICRLNDD